MTAAKTPVPRATIERRVRRRLAVRGRTLRYGANPWGGGDCYTVVDANRNTVDHTVPNLEAFAREVGALKSDETMEGGAS